VGEINPDLILHGVPREIAPEREILIDGFRVTLGSSSAIFAHNLAALGSRVGIVSKVGKDTFGRMSLAWLEEAGVDVAHVASTETVPTGMTVILAQPDQRFILTFPGTIFELHTADIDREYVFSARHLHLGSYFLQRALRPEIACLFREAKKKGLTTSLDTNDDPTGEWANDLLEVLPFVDILFPNEREVQKIARVEDTGEATRKLAELCGMVVVKKGSKGAIARKGETLWTSLPPRVNTKDAVGAGDSFNAGFIHRFLQGASTQDCLNFANLAGAYSTTCEGGVEAYRDREAMNRFFTEQLQS
jgi:sugar/nucleoside kinase (ribokinase family)